MRTNESALTAAPIPDPSVLQLQKSAQRCTGSCYWTACRPTASRSVLVRMTDPRTTTRDHNGAAMQRRGSRRAQSLCDWDPCMGQRKNRNPLLVRLQLELQGSAQQACRYRASESVGQRVRKGMQVRERTELARCTHQSTLSHTPIPPALSPMRIISVAPVRPPTASTASRTARRTR